MNRRTFIIGGILAGGAVVGAAFFGFRRPFPQALNSTGAGMFDRVIFVCVDRDGNYSPGVYLQETGGPDGMTIIPQAARFMRTPEVGDAAAGLCGYLYKQLGDDVASGGCLSLYDAPKAAADGKVDWQLYCAPNVDLVLVHVELGTADLYSGSADLKSRTKSLVRSISGLKFGA